MRKARVIIFFECPRNCDLCCNKHKSVMDKAKPINIKDICGYDEVMITGGEPLLRPDLVLEYAKQLRSQNNKSIYLYTADTSDMLDDIIEVVDGIHFTIHTNSDWDKHCFQRFQDSISHYVGLKSFRLHIFPDARSGVESMIIYNLWQRIDFTDWIIDSPLPQDEELFTLTLNKELK